MVVRPELERGLDLGRGDGAGEREHAELLAALDDRAAQAGRDDVAGAGGDGQVDLGDREHGAGPDEDVPAARHHPDRLLGGGGAEGDLGDGQAAGDQGAGQRVGVGRVVEHDHRHQARGS